MSNENFRDLLKILITDVTHFEKYKIETPI